MLVQDLHVVRARYACGYHHSHAAKELYNQQSEVEQIMQYLHHADHHAVQPGHQRISANRNCLDSACKVSFVECQ